MGIVMMLPGSTAMYPPNSVNLAGPESELATTVAESMSGYPQTSFSAPSWSGTGGIWIPVAILGIYTRK